MDLQQSRARWLLQIGILTFALTGVAAFAGWDLAWRPTPVAVSR